MAHLIKKNEKVIRKQKKVKSFGNKRVKSFGKKQKPYPKWKYFSSPGEYLKSFWSIRHLKAKLGAKKTTSKNTSLFFGLLYLMKRFYVLKKQPDGTQESLGKKRNPAQAKLFKNAKSLHFR